MLRLLTRRRVPSRQANIVLEDSFCYLFYTTFTRIKLREGHFKTEINEFVFSGDFEESGMFTGFLMHIFYNSFILYFMVFGLPDS